MNNENGEAIEHQQENIEVTDSGESSNSKSPEELLVAKDNEIQGYIDRIQRIQADFENYKKRIAREHESLTRSIENRVYLKVLPLFDNFQRAIQVYRENGDQNGLAEGVMQIFAQFEDLLAAEQIMQIDAVGESFDPMRHEALMSVESDQPPNTVLEEFECGFKRGKDILRPSRVKVSRKPAKSDIENGKGES